MTPHQTAAVAYHAASNGRGRKVVQEPGRVCVVLIADAGPDVVLVGDMPLLVGPDGRIWHEFHFGSAEPGKFDAAAALLERFYAGEINEEQLREGVAAANSIHGLDQLPGAQ